MSHYMRIINSKIEHKINNYKIIKEKYVQIKNAVLSLIVIQI